MSIDELLISTVDIAEVPSSSLISAEPAGEPTPSSAELLFLLHYRGVNVWTDSGRLCIRAPTNALSENEQNLLKTLRRELIQLIDNGESIDNVPLQPCAVGCSTPLTVQQQRSWEFSRRKNALESKRLCCMAVRVQGPLDTACLKISLGTLRARQKSLRTRFLEVEGVPRQHVDSRCDYDLPAIDLSKEETADREEMLRRLTSEFLEEKVDLRGGELFAARLYKISREDHILQLAIEHLVADDFSLKILDRELWELYSITMRNEKNALPPLPVQFGDYAIWQHRTAGTWLKEHGSYWKERLRNVSPLRLPLNDGSVKPAAVGSFLQVPFGETRSATLKEFCKREGILLPVAVLTAFSAVLSHWCMQSDMLLAFVVHGRSRPEIRDVIGLFANVTYLGIKLSSHDTFAGLLRTVDAEVLLAHKHAGIWGVPDFIGEPIAADIEFNWAPLSWPDALVGVPRKIGANTRLRPFPLRQIPWPAKFQPFFSDSAAGIVMTVIYRPDLLPASKVEAFGRDLRLFVDELMYRPHSCVGSLSTSSSFH